MRNILQSGGFSKAFDKLQIPPIPARSKRQLVMHEPNIWSAVAPQRPSRGAAFLNCSRRNPWVFGVQSGNPIESGLNSAAIVLVISGNRWATTHLKDMNTTVDIICQRVEILQIGGRPQNDLRCIAETIFRSMQFVSDKPLICRSPPKQISLDASPVHATNCQVINNLRCQNRDNLWLSESYRFVEYA